MKCNACGGTGDHFDKKTNDWVSPRTDCPACKGSGEVDEPCPHGPEEPCTCDGCWACVGHVVGCTCDIDWAAIAEHREGTS